MRAKLRRLLRLARGEFIEVPQSHGPPARFPERELADAFVSAVRRARGEPVEEHPLSAAARKSPDPEWSSSVVVGPEEVPEPPEDLSE